MTRTPKQQFDNYAEHMARMLGASAPPPRNRPRRPGIWASGGMADAPIQTFETADPIPDPRDEELAALRARVAELEARDRSVFQEAPLLPAPDALMSDWGEVGAYPGIPDDFVQLMTGEETLEQAVERMTLGVDELLDMATVLSDQSLELALCTVPPERVNEWTEKLITEKARLRRLRGTVDENFGRENLVSRVQGMFAQVGAKR